MTRKPDSAKESAESFSLRRWSQRKLDTARKSPSAAPAADAPAVPAATKPTTPALPPVVAELPPIESLTPESEFAPFFQSQVDETIKRAALKQLFRDPRFNVMDGLDIYVDDYTKAEPIPADVLKKLVQARYIFDPPPTELTPEGHVVDTAAAPAGEAPGLPPPVNAEPTAPVEAAAPSAPADDTGDAKR